MQNSVILSTLVALLVPVAVRYLRPYVARLPRPVVPLMASAIGELLTLLATWLAGADLPAGLGFALGFAGVGVREVVDQSVKEYRSRPKVKPAKLKPARIKR